jgi:hypothetical protein
VTTYHPPDDLDYWENQWELDREYAQLPYDEPPIAPSLGDRATQARAPERRKPLRRPGEGDLHD